MTGVMATEELDPLTDPRWRTLVESSAGGSIFHTPAWLEALRRTYGYEARALTTADADGELRGGLLFCRLGGWLRGRRLVSAPFSDHCEPLARSAEDLPVLLDALKAAAGEGGCSYVEIRPLRWAMAGDCGLERSQSFCHHLLDLTPSAAELFRSFHKDCVQRKIHRAEREGLRCEEGRSDELLRKFYGLQIHARRRLGLPPQPLAWFRNLAASMGEKLKVRVASKDGKPVAGMLTLQHRQTLVYKYGCSDKTFSNLGGMAWLFWKAIQDAKGERLAEFDLGRSDWENDGLIRFKDRLGARRSTITYWRYPASSAVEASSTWKLKAAKRVFSCLPSVCLPTAGKLLYRHLG